MPRKQILLGLMLIMFAVPFFYGPPATPVYSQDQLYAVRVLNATTIYAGESVTIYNIIVNMETWELHNITFAFSITPEQGGSIANVQIVQIINASGVETDINFGTNSIYISVSIKYISMNTTFSHWIVVKFNDPGNYSIITEEPISLVRTKGELKEEVSDLGINDASVEVKEKPKPYPPEGNKDVTFLALFMTVILPILIIAISNRLLGAHR